MTNGFLSARSLTPQGAPGETGQAEGNGQSETNSEQSDDPDAAEQLNERERELLLAYLALDATSKRRSLSLTAAARKADPYGKVASYKRANARLVQLGLLEKLSQQEGKQMYLSMRGKGRAEQEKNQHKR